MKTEFVQRSLTASSILRVVIRGISYCRKKIIEDYREVGQAVKFPPPPPFIKSLIFKDFIDLATL